MQPEQLGDYVVQKQIGQGAYGAVYLAHHRFIKRPFALKVLPEEVMQDPAAVKRVEQEVAEIAALDHPHILRIHNVSFVGNSLFLVTDPIIDSFGETMHLERFLQLKGKMLVEEEQLRFLKQIASAIDEAHAKQVVHGSLRPSNVLVAPSGEGVKMVLSDFGVSRIVGEGYALASLAALAAKALPPLQSEHNRKFLQALSFLSPEAKAAEAIAASDSYAFGVMVYWFLCGKLPEGNFEPLSRLVPHLKLNWDLFVKRCLHPNPMQRPAFLETALTEVLAMQSLPEIEETLDSHLQMNFEFQRKEAAVGAAEIPKPVLKPTEIVRPEYEADPAAIFQRDLLVSHYEPKKVEIEEVEPLLTEMVIIPGGTYTRGSNEGARDEMPRHPVTLNSFALDVHPVTNEQFVRFLQAMGGEKDRNNNDIIRLRDSRVKRSAGKLVIESGYAKHPVVGVTWYGAMAYARWVGKRLPTEAEWEVAATGGKEGTLFPTGAEIERTQANFFSSDTTPVGSYPSNSYGLFDMAGNVYEWCQDWYAYNYYDASALEPANPMGPHQGVYRVLRGGCWKSLKEDLRCSHRHRNNPGAVNGTYGFRCAADVN